MAGYSDNLQELTKNNESFRRVLYTTRRIQLVIMSLLPGEEIGEEVHGGDQFFRFETGEGKALIDNAEHQIGAGAVLIVPAGHKHNIINTSASEMLKFYTVYSPPEHRDGTVHNSRAEALGSEEHFDGKISP